MFSAINHIIHLIRRSEIHMITHNRYYLFTHAGSIGVQPGRAHCDSMCGPVAKDAQEALAGERVDLDLKWVGEDGEAAIRDAFEMALAVRGESEVARNVAENYSFETLARIHRAPEGEGFTGLKPAGSVGPVIAAADRALKDGKDEKFTDETAAAVREGIQQRFHSPKLRVTLMRPE